MSSSLCRFSTRRCWTTMPLSSGYDTSSSANRTPLLGKEHYRQLFLFTKCWIVFSPLSCLATKRNESPGGRCHGLLGLQMHTSSSTKNLATIKVSNQINLILTPVKLLPAALYCTYISPSLPRPPNVLLSGNRAAAVEMDQSSISPEAPANDIHRKNRVALIFLLLHHNCCVSGARVKI